MSNISTIAVNLEKVCGGDVKSPIDKQFLVIDKAGIYLYFIAVITNFINSENSGSRSLSLPCVCQIDREESPACQCAV